MTTRRLVIGVVVLLALAGIVLLGRQYLERVPVTIWRGASAEVRRQPRLAFERLLAAGGVAPTLVSPGQPGTALPPRGVLWLAEDDADGSRAAVERVWGWVDAGGTLVLSPGEEGGPFSTRLGLRRRSGDTRPTRRVFVAPGTITVAVPGRARRFEIEAPTGFLLPRAPRRAHGDGAGGLAVAEVAHGRGRIVAVADLAAMWTNERVGREQHAAFLWELARLDGPHVPLLFTVVPEPDVTVASVAKAGWPVLVAAAALGLLALWRVLPRPGPVWQPTPPARRQLGEHLQAVGTFQLREGRDDALVDAARRVVRERLRRQPWLERPSDRLALTPSRAARTDFLDTLQRLHDLWRRLHRA